MEFYNVISDVLGLKLEPNSLTLLHVTLRAVVVLIATLAMARLAEKRFLARINALDAMLAFILGSMLSRAINGSASFFPTLAGGFVLVLLHRVISALAYRSEKFGNLVKGKEEVVIDQGQIHEKRLRRNHITRKDLFEELRLNGNLDSPDKVKKAVIERSGEISVVKDAWLKQWLHRARSIEQRFFQDWCRAESLWSRIPCENSVELHMPARAAEASPKAGNVRYPP